jgi:hypothetical protein
METAHIVLHSEAFYQSIEKSTLPRAITAHSPLVGRDRRRLIIIAISSPPKKQVGHVLLPSAFVDGSALLPD